MRTTVTELGQTEVPEQIRQDHGIGPESRLEWIDDGRTIRIVPIPPDPIRAARGSSQGLTDRLLEARRDDRARG